MATFADVLTIINGKNQSKVENPNGQYPIYGSGGIIGWADDYLCEANTVIIGRKGNINKPIYVEAPFWNVDTAFGLRANEHKLVPKYLFYFCESFDFEKLNTTVTIPSLTRANLLKIVIPLPDLPTQRRIAATLDKVSESIALCKQMMADLDELVKSQFVEMFGDPVKNERAWAMKPIKELYSVGSSKRVYASEQTTTGVPFLRVSDICSLIDGDEIHPSLYISEDRFAELMNSDLVPTENDILVTSRGTIGRCYIMKASDKFYFQDGMVTWLRKKCCDVEPQYMSTLFAADSFAEVLDKATNKTTVHYISIDKLASISIPVPPVKLQEQFATFVAQADKSKLAVQQQLAELEMLKKSLMQEYFE